MVIMPFSYLSKCYTHHRAITFYSQIQNNKLPSTTYGSKTQLKSGRHHQIHFACTYSITALQKQLWSEFSFFFIRPLKLEMRSNTTLKQYSPLHNSNGQKERKHLQLLILYLAHTVRFCPEMSA